MFLSKRILYFNDGNFKKVKFYICLCQILFFFSRIDFADFKKSFLNLAHYALECLFISSYSRRIR